MSITWRGVTRHFADDAAYAAWLATPEGAAWTAEWDAGTAWMEAAFAATAHRRPTRGWEG